MKKTVIAWGRMNPMTTGHEILVKKVQDTARRERADPRIYLSHTQNAKKDPLQYKDKIVMARKAFGSVVKVSQSRTLIQLMQELQEAGFTEVIMVAGSDRVQEYKTLLNRYNGKDYTFDSIKIESAGERDPDAEGASGMSASKLRQAAASGDEKRFLEGVPSEMSKADAMKLYALVRKGLLVEEIKTFLETNKMKPEITDKDFSDEELQKLVDETPFAEIDKEVDDEDEEDEEDEEGDELKEDALLERTPLTLQQRIKKARIMRRLAPRLKRQRALKKFRMATGERLTQRARKLARNILRRKFAGERGAHYATLPIAQKISVDKLIANKDAVVSRIVKRLIPMVRRKEVERLRQARRSPTDTAIKAPAPAIGRFENVSPISKSAVDPLHETAKDRDIQKTFDQLRQSYKPAINSYAEKSRFNHVVETVRKNKVSNSYSGIKELDKSQLALLNKANIAEVSFEIIQAVYNRGVESWNKNPRTSTTAEQWGFARVNTFIAELKDGNLKQDKDLDNREDKDIDSDKSRVISKFTGSKKDKIVLNPKDNTGI